MPETAAPRVVTPLAPSLAPPPALARAGAYRGPREVTMGPGGRDGVREWLRCRQRLLPPPVLPGRGALGGPAPPGPVVVVAGRAR